MRTREATGPLFAGTDRRDTNAHWPMVQAVLVAALVSLLGLASLAQPVSAAGPAQQVTLIISITGGGGGGIVSSPAGISCNNDTGGGSCMASFSVGTQVTLSATPDPRSSFTGWSGACPGTAPCSITLDADRTVTAIFTLNPLLTVNLAGNGTGSVTSVGPGPFIDCVTGLDGPSCRANVPPGTTVTLAAAPTDGSIFNGWGGACSGSGACVVTMAAAQTVSATFTTTTVQLLQQPQRVADTRTGSGPIPSGSAECFTVAAPGTVIPLEAAAVVLNVTAVGYGARGWLTVYPAGQPAPDTSTLDFDPAEYAIANNIVVGLTSGIVCVKVGTVDAAAASVHVVLDATGYVPVGQLAGMPMLPAPQRLVDTRVFGGPIVSGTARCFTVVGQTGIPADAAAVLLNVTAVGYGARGWLTAYPAGQQVPPTSTVNFDTSAYATANGAVVGIGRGGQLCVAVGTVNAAPGSSQVVLDATGYVTSASMVTMLNAPQRLVDTRTMGGPIASGTSRCFKLTDQGMIGPQVAGLVVNVTAVGYTTRGWLTLYPAGQPVPTTSTLNFDAAEYAIANGAIVAVDRDGHACVSVGTVNGVPGSADVIIDAVGYLDLVSIPLGSRR